jgi:PAS domain S-box-containing protein
MSVPVQHIGSSAMEPCAILVHAPQPQSSDIESALRSVLPQARVRVAQDAQASGLALRDPNWDLVIVSLDADPAGGLESLAQARARTTAALLAVGTNPRTADVVAAMRAGADDFLPWDRAAELGHVAAGLVAQHEPLASSASEAALPGQQATLVFDASWRVSACNAEVGAVLGYEPHEVIGQPVAVLFDGVPGGAAMAERLRSLAARETLRDETWMRRRDGLHMRAEITARNMAPDGSPVQFGLAVHDATLHYRASHSLRHQADLAAAGTAGRNLFIGSVAHELRAALAPISTSAVILERQRQPAEMQDKLVRIVRRNVTAAARLVEDLLEFSTRTARKMVLRPTLVDLHQLLMECTEPARQQAALGGIQFKLQFGSSQTLSQVLADADRIRQVVANLLGNALKFTPAGGSVTLRTSAEPDAFCIEVSDTGVGVDPAVLPFIFDPFEQGGIEMTQRHGGFGLGLAVSAAIAEQHGGQLVAWSAGQGCGTTFRLTLPRRRLAPARGSDAAPSSGLNVLYVEDNRDAADAMRYALGTIGWSMLHASTCAQARELFARRAGDIDVVLADLGLPDGSGLDLGPEMCAQVPVVALTAYGAPLALKGFADQLIKPAEISEVQRALAKAVAMRRNVVLA